MRHPTQDVPNIGELIKLLHNDIPQRTRHVWFRGQSDSSWDLVPSLGRKNKVVQEYTLMQKFKQRSSLLIPKEPSTEFEWLLIMQHNGVPTRLLDWSENPLAALYFCVNERLLKTGSLWVLLPEKLNKSGNFKPSQPVAIPSHNDDNMKIYAPDQITLGATKPRPPAAFIAPRNTPRMQAQLGAFTIIHSTPISVETVGDGKHAWKYNIESNVKNNIRKDLALLGIDRFTLFPELPSIGETLKAELK